MLCGILTQKYKGRKRRLRRPLKISAPIPIEEMQFRTSQVATNINNARPDSGVFYLVPKKSGTGKTIVRRPVPPPSSTPLDDNFDAITQATTERFASLRRRPVLAVKISSDRFETMAPMKPVQAKYDPIERFRNSWRERGLFNSSTSLGGKQSKGKEKAQDPPQTQSATPSASVGPSKERSSAQQGTPKAGSIRQAAEIQNTSWVNSPDPIETTRTNSTVKNMQQLLKGRRHKSSVNGPKAGQRYEIVDRQVIEHNPERTVTISTWREQVAKAHSDTDSMSVYFVNATEYAQETPVEETITQVFEHREQSLKSTSSSSAEDQSTQRIQGQSVVKQPRISSSGTRKPNGLRHSKTAVHTNGNTNGNATQYHVESEARDSVRQSSTNKLGREPSQRSKMEEGTSFIHPRAKRRHHESTPVEKQQLPKTPSFHPTLSGSTISSIRPLASVEVEEILDSCEPSLVHILPILARLGIMKVDHLRAIAKLTSGTRDREVKEDALRFGVTVVEWAILLDKIFTL